MDVDPQVKQEEGSVPSLGIPPPSLTGQEAQEEEEYDPSRPSFPAFTPSSSVPPPFTGGPPPPTRVPSTGFPAPPPPNFAGLPPHILAMGAPPPPPSFLSNFRPPPSSSSPFANAPPPPPSTNPYLANAPPIPAGYLPSPKHIKPLPSGPRIPAQNVPLGGGGGGGGKKKGGRSANISDNLRRALYQDEKYVLHEPVWKVVGGQMTRLHFVETSPSNLPITKVIATSKLDAISIHARLLEKSQAAIFYSDGSMKNGWAWGAAVEWIRDGTARGKIGGKLREELGMCDPTDAEMGALRKALEAFSMVGKLERDELIIFTDSQAAITLVDSGIRYQSQLFMSTLERTLTLHPKVKVTLVWIPGHVGIAGNELADRMAVCGSTTSFLARRAGRLPGVPDQGGDVPVLLSRKMPTADGEGVGEEKTLPLDDSLTASEGSLFVARFPEAATANDLEVLFGQFGKLASIDMFSIPPVNDRFAILSFIDSSVVAEAIQWLDDQPVTLPTRYAEGRDCEVWKGWQGSLKLATNEVGRLVPPSVASLFPGLPAWATQTQEERGTDEVMLDKPSDEDVVEDELIEDVVPHAGHGDRLHGASSISTQASPALSAAGVRASLPPSSIGLPSNPALNATHSLAPMEIKPIFPSPSASSVVPTVRAPSATPSVEVAAAPPQKRYEDMTPSERFLLTYQGFGPGPGNKPLNGGAAGAPTGPKGSDGGDRKRRRKSRDHLPPVPVSTLTGLPAHVPAGPRALSGSAGSISPVAQTTALHHSPAGGFPPPPHSYGMPPPPTLMSAPAPTPTQSTPTPSTFASGLPVSVTPNGLLPDDPKNEGESPLPTSIAEMARLILDLQADNAHLDAQHSRLTVVTREPADWSLALAALAKAILKEQEALEGARRQRAKAEDQVVDWENVLQRNNVGIEERRGFVLDVLDVLDASALEDTSIITSLRKNIEVKTASLQNRMSLLPPTTAQIVQSCEDIFLTLNRALEEQKMALDEAERRSSVLGGLVSIRRDAAGSWRGRREEIDLVVQQLMGGPPPPTAPAAMRH